MIELTIDFDYSNVFNDILNADIYKSYKEGEGVVKYSIYPMSLDTETSKLIYEGQEVAFPYIYIFGLNGVAYFTPFQKVVIDFFEKFNYFLENSNLNLLCMVHNLPYDFNFLNGWLPWSNIFAKNEAKPLVGYLGNVKVVDSLQLSGVSLAKLANMYSSREKLKGDLDYSVFRTPKDVYLMTEKELKYCEHDVLILNDYYVNFIVPNFIKIGKKSKIPLTKTGIVRERVKSNISNKLALYYKLIAEENTAHVKDLLEEAFIGGLVKSNTLNTDVLLHDCQKWDETSAYPGVMFRKHNYPMTKFKKSKCKSFKRFDPKKAYLVQFRVSDMRSKAYMSMWSFSKVKNAYKPICDNGRILSLEYGEITATNIDVNILLKFYDFKYSIIEIYEADTGYLPRYLIKALVDMYQTKNELKVKLKVLADELTNKGVDYESNIAYIELNREYMGVKNDFNSLYGCTVTKDNPTNWELSSLGVWEQIPNKNYRKIKRSDFLMYQWGVWVTANAREVLSDAWLECGSDCAYSDTDSVVNLGDYSTYFSSINTQIREEVKEACEYYGADFEKMRGIGEWDLEGVIKDFKTLGSKRYYHDGHVTISGISDRAFREEAERRGVSVLDIFKDGVSIDAKYTYKNTSKYYINREEPLYYYYDANEDPIILYSWVYLEPSPWSLTVPTPYKSLIANMQGRSIDS